MILINKIGQHSSGGTSSQLSLTFAVEATSMSMQKKTLGDNVSAIFADGHQALAGLVVRPELLGA